MQFLVLVSFYKTSISLLNLSETLKVHFIAYRFFYLSSAKYTCPKDPLPNSFIIVY